MPAPLLALLLQAYIADFVSGFTDSRRFSCRLYCTVAQPLGVVAGHHQLDSGRA